MFEHEEEEEEEVEIAPLKKRTAFHVHYFCSQPSSIFGILAVPHNRLCLPRQSLVFIFIDVLKIPNVAWLATGTEKNPRKIYSDKQIVFKDCELALSELFIGC